MTRDTIWLLIPISDSSRELLSQVMEGFRPRVRLSRSAKTLLCRLWQEGGISPENLSAAEETAAQELEYVGLAEWTPEGFLIPLMEEDEE